MRCTTMALLTLCASFGFLSSGETGLAATLLTVTKTTDTDDGVCDGDCSLREAITAAASGDTIRFSSLFDTPQTITLAGNELVIDKDLTIAGTGADKLTVSGDNQCRVFHVLTPARLSLSGMTITAGNADAGGGIFNDGGVLTVTECHVTGNTAYIGGGIGSFVGGVTLRNSAVSDNIASGRGGGVWFEDNLGFILTVTNSTISGNIVTGIFGEGGGISALTFSGGFFKVRVANSTITDNFPDGMIAAAPSVLGVSLESSIVAANQMNDVMPDIGGAGLSGDYNLIGNATGTADAFLGTNIAGDSVVQADPKLGPLEYNGGPTPTHALLPCSLAIDRGQNYAQEAADQRGDGFSRTIDFPEIPSPTDGTDIGAFEAQTLTPAVCNTGPPTVNAASITLQQGTSARLQIATIADPDGLFGVRFGLSPKAANGVTVSNLRMDTLSIISADVAASCTAADANFTLLVSDGQFDSFDMLAVGVTPETTPPVIVTAPDPITLSPNNHKYATGHVGGIVYSASDNCDSSVNVDRVVITQVTSDEPENAPGDSDGNTIDDIIIAPDCKSVQLRVERDGKRDGRVYTITVQVSDASGNTATATRRVTVPLSQNGDPAIESAPQYTVVSACS